jgi:hypothetical protein
VWFNIPEYGRSYLYPHLDTEMGIPILTDMNPWLENYFFRKPLDRRLRCD